MRMQKASTGPSPRNAFFNPFLPKIAFSLFFSFVSRNSAAGAAPPRSPSPKPPTLQISGVGGAPSGALSPRRVAMAGGGPAAAAAAAGDPSTVVRRRRTELSLATYFDIAVVRCLFISHWSEEGVYWALTYLSRRLKGILVILLQIR